MMLLYISMVRSSYIINVSGMGDDVPILGALVTLFGGDELLLFLMMFLYISMVGSSNIIILSGMGHTCQFWVLWSHF